MADLDEALKTANEMVVVLSATDLSSSFKELQSLYEEEDRIRRKNIKDAREIIKKLQGDFEAEEKKASDLGPQNSYSEDVFQENLESKEAAIAKMKEDIKDLESKEKNLAEKINETVSKTEIVEEKKKKLEEEREKMLQESKSFFDLYLQTTGIHWDFNAPDNEIKGFIASKRDIKPFSLNTSDHDSFYTANYLWDLIDATQGD